jgi:hypothetical protein
LELNEAAGFSPKVDDNPEMFSEDSESSEYDNDDQLDKIPQHKQAVEQKESPPRKPQRFKMVGLDSNQDFRSFVPGNEYEQNPAQKVWLFICQTIIFYN